MSTKSSPCNNYRFSTLKNRFNSKRSVYSLERATTGIGLHVNAHKTEYMCYNQTGDITTLDDITTPHFETS